MVSVLERKSPPVGVKSSSVETTGILSEGIIPAVPGEFYSYSSEFTEAKPLYVLMKCKANKARSIAAAEELGREANLVFRFNDSTKVRVCSIAEHIEGPLRNLMDVNLFGETWIAVTALTLDEFSSIRLQRDAATLVEVCKLACSDRGSSLELYPGAVVAMMTDGGKYGLFLVKQLTSQSVQIDACHILL